MEQKLNMNLLFMNVFQNTKEKIKKKIKKSCIFLKQKRKKKSETEYSNVI